jgi:hypothetical protein
MEQELHERYDEDSESHTSSYHETVHRRNNDGSYRQENTYSYQMSQQEKDGRAGKKVILVIVIVVVIALVAGGIAGAIRSFVRNNLDSYADNTWDFDITEDDIWDDDDDWYDEEHEDEIYVEYAWSEYLGADLSKVDWDEIYVNISDEGIRQLSQLPVREGYVYHVITLDVQNNTDATYDLDEIGTEDLEFWIEGENGSTTEEIPCIKCFDQLYSEVESGEEGWIDCLVQVPENTEELYGECMFDEESSAYETFICDMDDE